MDFAFSENHLDIKNLSEDILKDHSNPERLKKLEADGPYLDQELWRKLVEAGIHVSSFPEALGGIDMDFLASMQVVENIGKTMVSIPYIPCVISTCLPLISEADNKSVNDALQAVASGDSLITTAYIESGNEDPLKPKVKATKNGDSYKISGSKHCVPYAKDASKILLSAKSDEGLWLGFISTSDAGIELTQQKATSNEDQYQVELKDVSGVTIALGTEAEELMQKSIAMTITAYCALAGGIAEAMTKISGEYTTERKQFGVALATFQAVAHKLADSYIDTECLKIISLKAASDISHGNYKSNAIAMAKVWCGDVMHRVSQTSQQVHGGTGIDRDYHLFRYCLWAKQVELSLGHSRIHLASLADNLAERYLNAL